MLTVRSLVNSIHLQGMIDNNYYLLQSVCIDKWITCKGTAQCVKET